MHHHALWDHRHVRHDDKKDVGLPVLSHKAVQIPHARIWGLQLGVARRPQ
jgi:hypothetical protein